MVLFEVDPSIIKPGWIPFVITVGLGIVIFLLYLSMKHQMAKIQVPPAAGPVKFARRDPEIDMRRDATFRSGAGMTSRQRVRNERTKRRRSGHDAG